MEIEKGEFIGTLSKTYGTDGRILLKFDPVWQYLLNELELVLIEVNNVPVPFFIEDIRFRNNRSAIIKFKDFDSEEIIIEFVGQKIYLDAMSQTQESNKNDLTGFLVRDNNFGEIGKVDEIIEYPQNAVLKVNYKGREVFIPLSDELIIKIYKKKKIIITDCPEGLFDIND